ncbi:MAG: hypothetical protein ACO1QR_17465 [Chthoniobacteraceae bacterium]
MPLHRQFYCKVCGCERTFWKHTLRHRTDALLTAITLGLWSVVWVTKTIRHWRKPWRCRECATPLRGHRRRRLRSLSGPEVAMEMPIALPVRDPESPQALARHPRQAFGATAAGTAQAERETQTKRE